MLNVLNNFKKSLKHKYFYLGKTSKFSSGYLPIKNQAVVNLVSFP